MIGNALGQPNLLIDGGMIWIAGDATGMHLVPLDDLRSEAAIAVHAPIASLFRDREGTIWAGGRDGLHRYSRSPFVTLTGIGNAKTGFARDPQDNTLYVAAQAGLARHPDRGRWHRSAREHRRGRTAGRSFRAARHA
ncbi:MAG: hypothetical protein QM681_19045 [Novosphingobium sp.]